MLDTKKMTRHEKAVMYLAWLRDGLANGPMKAPKPTQETREICDALQYALRILKRENGSEAKSGDA